MEVLQITFRFHMYEYDKYINVKLIDYIVLNSWKMSCCSHLSVTHAFPIIFFSHRDSLHLDLSVVSLSPHDRKPLILMTNILLTMARHCLSIFHIFL